MTRLAAKLLSAVEVNPAASHQHEFHAGMLRTALGLPEAVSGQLFITYIDDEGDLAQEVCDFTLYDSREGRPRPPEYRLYFSSTELQRNASEGDILVMVRGNADDELRCLVGSQRSAPGRELATLLGEAGVSLDRRFREITEYLERSQVAHLLDTTTEPEIVWPPEDLLPLADADFIASTLARGVLPSTLAMAQQAGRMVSRFASGQPEPDDFLTWCLEAETTLFNHLEQQIAQKELDALQQSGAIRFADATVLVLRRLQSRKSRRGQSLQHHFSALLRMRGIRHGQQCQTESGERPDFVVPGCTEYGDSAYPSARLRMIACKSSLKDRWAQILKEAERIPEKYLLTLDRRITEDQARRVSGQRVLIFVPQAIIRAAYVNSGVAEQLRNVAALVDLLVSA